MCNVIASYQDFSGNRKPFFVSRNNLVGKTITVKKVADVQHLLNIVFIGAKGYMGSN